MTRPWSRQLDPAEAYFARMDQVSVTNFTVWIECHRELDPGSLRKALNAIQVEERLLGVAIEKAEGQLAFVWRPGSEIALTLREAFEHDWDRIAETEVVTGFEDGVAPLMRCILLIDLQSHHSSVGLTFHHAIADARCAAELARRLFERLGSSCAGADVSASRQAPVDLPPLHDRFPVHLRSAQNAGLKRQIARDFALQAMKMGPLTVLPWFAARCADRRLRIHRLSISRDAWERLAGRWRDAGASCHGLLSAIQLIATHEALGIGELHNLLLCYPADLRPHVEPAVPLSPVQLHVTNLFSMHTIGPDMDACKLGREVAVKVRHQLASGEGHLFYSSHDVARGLSSPLDTAEFAEIMARQPGGSVLSTVGRISAFGEWSSVRNVGFVMCPARNQAFYCFASVFGRRPSITVICDEANLLPGVGDRIARAMQDVLDRVVKAGN